MLRLAHIINPVKVDETSGLFTAQPITFESMRVAKDFAADTVEVMLFTAQYQEDRSIIPDYFTVTDDLERSILDIGTFSEQRKFPFIKEIFDRLYSTADADYCIYSNVDITLMPNFYLTIARYIESGYDAFVVNRRTISSVHSSIADLPEIYAEIGTPHDGYDCFIFKRELLEKFSLGNVCIGIPNVGLVLAVNLAYHAEKFMEFHDVHLTCHLGDDKGWKVSKFEDYCKFNTREGHRVSRSLWTNEKLENIPSSAGILLNKYFRFLKSLD